MLTYESQMIPILSAHKDKLGDFEFETQELSSGYGIADMVFYNLNPNIRKAKKHLPVQSQDVLRILTELQNEDDLISVTVLKKKLARIQNKSEALTYLIDNGYLQEQEVDASYKKLKDYEVGFQDVVAIEAKLKDWRRGLYQAYRYRDYANRSYLALYSPYIHRAKKFIGEFEKFNVGLIEVGDDSLEIIFEPKRQEIRANIISATAFENALLAI